MFRRTIARRPQTSTPVTKPKTRLCSITGHGGGVSAPPPPPPPLLPLLLLMLPSAGVT